MRWLGAGRRIGRRLLVVAVFGLWSAQPGHPRPPCEEAFYAKAWARVVEVCQGPRWWAWQRLGRAWEAWMRGDKNETLALAEPLVDTEVSADAAYIAGYLHGDSDVPDERARSRALLEKALAEFQRAGRHADASRAAEFLSRVAHPDSRFSEELQMAQLAAAEADASGDDAPRSKALAALAEAYDWIGMAEAARETFERAARLAEDRPDQLAFLHFKRAVFLLDLGTPQDLDASLRYLDAAADQRRTAIARGLARNVAALEPAIRLNRADALSQLGRLEAADRELAAVKAELGPGVETDSPEPEALAKLHLVEGYVAARRHDPATAEVRFRQAEVNPLQEDYRWRIALELARSYRAAGRSDLAEDAYGSAITIIEQLRGAAAGVELRPWVLARRTLPYVELLGLLVEQHRGIDALVVAESLHARAWLDVVLGNEAARQASPELALTAARIRQRLNVGSAPPLDRRSLMAAIGDREAVVFLTLDSVTWRAHVVEGDASFDRLPEDALEAARQFLRDPGDPGASERAAEALLPADLSDRRTPLYVVATGPLADVPFAALRWRHQFLVQARAVARLPGLAALHAPASTWDERAILLGDSRGNLPGAAREVRELAASLGTVAHVGAAASRQVLASARGARILHIAAHGIMTAAGRAIVLADGNLTAAGVLDAGLDARLVVLSGCATASSRDAESWDGFPSAFLAAGSRYVVATLVSVNDTDAARMIEAYYAQSPALDPLERLAAAQRLVSAEFPVSAWASFAAWGSSTCDESPGACSFSPRAASPSHHADVRSASTAKSHSPGALPRRPRSLYRGGRRPGRVGARP